MALVVLAYPRISASNFAWIQAVRATHDKLNYSIVDPHFTMVFPVAGVPQSDLIDHVRRTSRSVPAIPFALRSAIIIKDAFSEYTHVFLIPDEGFGSLVRLHDALYTGILEPHLRLDIPFIPHVGIGNDLDPLKAKQLAGRLNGEGLAVNGVIASLIVASYENNEVKTLEEIELSQ